MRRILPGSLIRLSLFFLAMQLHLKSNSQVIIKGGTQQMVSQQPTGGILKNAAGFNIHSFLNTDSLIIPAGFTATNAEILIIAGGGGGGYRHAGGGGAGGLIDITNYSLTNGQKIIIGNGGTGSSGGAITHGFNGSNSSVGSSVAIGGGGGGNNTINGVSGGSGGGGSNGSFGGSGTSSQGTVGGNQNNGNGCCFFSGAGGGGYVAAGANTTGLDGSKGGDGASSQISGSLVYYAGGGGGGYGNTPSYKGGLGGGGDGGTYDSMPGKNGTINTGGGGGGGGATGSLSGPGGNGGSGIVILKYPYTSTTGIWSSSNTNIATIDASSGIATGVSQGTTTISYIVTNGSMTSTYTQTLFVTTPLPITLVYFEASYKNCTANLIWKSASEINSSYYAIEYSQDGSSFSQVAKLDAANKINGAAYTKSFSNVPTGKAYYRLKMVDTDGKFTFSKIVAIATNDICNATIALRVRPNPSTDIVIVDGLKNGNHLTLINSEGIKLKSFVANGISQKINLRQYPGGIYLINVIAADGSVKTLQVVKK